MPTTTVSSLHIYPIKSTAGITLSSAKVNELGLAFDRRFVLSDPSGQFITARTSPKLCLVRTSLISSGDESEVGSRAESGITLSAPNMPTLTLKYHDFKSQYQNITLWGDNIAGQVCSITADKWFSDYLQHPCQLLFFGKNSYRERKSTTNKTRKLAFADGYPLLLISQASLNDLNQRLTNNQLKTVSMTQFRPNIVVEHCLPFAEDTWQHIRIGEVEFMVSKPCERCVFTTVNPETGEKHTDQQPLKTLKSYRKTEQGEVLFGQNLIPLNKGEIKQGDKLEVLTLQKPPTFSFDSHFSDAEQGVINTETSTGFASTELTSAKLTSTKLDQVPNKKVSIYFKKWQKKYQGDNQKTLLEHGESAGLILPYSCLAGMCGSCKAKLVSGEVQQSSTEGLTTLEKQQGYILCCSAIATSDVIIEHE